MELISDIFWLFLHTHTRVPETAFVHFLFKKKNSSNAKRFPNHYWFNVNKMVHLFRQQPLSISLSRACTSSYFLVNVKHSMLARIADFFIHCWGLFELGFCEWFGLDLNVLEIRARNLWQIVYIFWKGICNV